MHASDVPDVPLTLRRWFVAHFVVDLAFAVPLLAAPEAFLTALGWTQVDPVAARLVGAALLGIGTQSFLGRNEGVAVYNAMLNLKILWSSSAIFGLMACIFQGAPAAAWAILSAFIAFSGVWMHYRIRLKQLAIASDHDHDVVHDAPP